MTAVEAHKMLKKAIERAGLSPDISWHWLRHSCASHFLQKGDIARSRLPIPISMMMMLAYFLIYKID